MCVCACVGGCVLRVGRRAHGMSRRGSGGGGGYCTMSPQVGLWCSILIRIDLSNPTCTDQVNCIFCLRLGLCCLKFKYKTFEDLND